MTTAENRDGSLIAVLGERLRRGSSATLATIGFAAGAIALATVLVGFGTWILLGAALVAFVLSGWALLVRPHPRSPLQVTLERVLIASVLFVAIAVLTGLYNRFLGPSWVP